MFYSVNSHVIHFNDFHIWFYIKTHIISYENSYLDEEAYIPWYKMVEKVDRLPVRYYNLHPEEDEKEKVIQIRYQTDNK